MASGDTALWLHNKLGSTDDLWSGKTICSQLSRDKLLSIQGCFYTLQPHVKVKVMLSFLHLPRRNVEEWQKEMEEILTIASGDSDHWVSTVAEILQTFPETGALKLDLENNSAFAEILADLKKVVRKNVDNRMLPIECQFLNKTALLSVAGQLPQPVKHFALKRKPKSATLRAELLQKSTEVANNRKNNVNNTVPVKVRNFSKKLDDPTFTKTTPTNNRSPSSANPLTVAGTPGTPSTPTSTTPSTSNCFLSASTGLSRSSSLTPRATASTGSLRGKEGGIKLIEIAEQPVGAKEAKRRKKIADQEAIGQQKKEKETATAATSTVETTTSYTPDYAVGLVTPALAKLPTPVGVTSTNSLSTTTPTYVPTTNAWSPVGPTILSVTNTSSSTTPQKEHVSEAKEMFSTSNKVTRPEKALILAFMAGSRVNPCPEQGDIISIRLSENEEIRAQPEGTKKVTVETFFQMNYVTGEWKRVSKTH
uniref:HDAg domain-containing protein n=1 Tax=Octopus bimaculoides TaxID=37653 RepID=A0A0L8GYK3_OCTBM|eukprot:XP_014777249.1 PREDICTED: negative elongation factor A-like [Octopus bimaculoides]